LFFSESMGIWKVLGIGLVFASIVVMSMASKTIKQKSLYSDSDEINV
jgi:drug/metabolite transporter (DMT)-like permease